jgi:hypothetical protein
MRTAIVGLCFIMVRRQGTETIYSLISLYIYIYKERQVCDYQERFEALMTVAV